MPATVESIDKFAFYNCTGLEEMVIPNSVTTIGDYAFRGCTGIRSVIIPGSVTEMGKHALHGTTKANIYCEALSVPAYWSERWNSSYRPVVWGCVLSDDGTYVVSVTMEEGTISNEKAKNSVTGPQRSGYTFSGWATDAEAMTVVYTAAQLTGVPQGTTLYAVWTPIEISEE
jgi:uncharacterized repeat protein (TIGR02543 family)